MDNSSSLELLQKKLTELDRKRKDLREQLRDIESLRERFVIAIDVLQNTTSDVLLQELATTKKVPIRVHVMEMFNDKSVLTVTEVWEGISDKVKTTKATVNTILVDLVSAGKLQKRAIGQYCKATKITVSSVPRRRLLRD